MQTVPLQAVPNQIAKAILGGQNVQIRVNQRGASLFADVNAGGVDIVTTVIARDLAPIVCRKYAGFVGNLVFVDTQGSAPPEYTGLGGTTARWQLVYLNAAEAAQLVQ